MLTHLPISTKFLTNKDLSAFEMRLSLALLSQLVLPVKIGRSFIQVELSLSQLVELTGMPKAAVCKTMKSLEKRCRKCFVVGCACTPDVGMVIRLRRRGGHDSTSYWLWFAETVIDFKTVARFGYDD